jgi:hypothetical protein
LHGLEQLAQHHQEIPTVLLFNAQLHTLFRNINQFLFLSGNSTNAKHA